MTLDLLSRLLGDKPSFLDNPHPTALDALVAAHILLITVPPFPNDLLRSLVIDSYPTLLAHSRRLQSRTLVAPGASQGLAASLSSSFEVVEPHAHQSEEEFIPLRIRAAPQATLSEVISSLAVPFSSRPVNPFSTRKTKPKSKEDKDFDRMRWGWFGLAALSIVGWAWTIGLRLELVPVESLDREEYAGQEDQNGNDEAYEGGEETSGDESDAEGEE